MTNGACCGGRNRYNCNEITNRNQLNLSIRNENFISAPKIQNNFCALPKCLIFQFCDSNIGFFSNAPHLVNALPKLQVVALYLLALYFVSRFYTLIHSFFPILLSV